MILFIIQTGINGNLITEKKCLTTTHVVLTEANKLRPLIFNVFITAAVPWCPCFAITSSIFFSGQPLLGKALAPSGNQHNQWQDSLIERKGEWLCAWLSGSSVLIQTVPSNERHDLNDNIPRKRATADPPHTACCHKNAYCHQRHKLRSKSRDKTFGISWLLPVCIKSFVSLAMFKWNIYLSILSLNFLLVLKAKSNHPWKIMKRALFSQETAQSL